MSNHRPHKHLLVDGLIKYAPRSEEKMKALIVSIIESIGMKVAELSNGQANPIAWYCNDPDNQGMTAGGILTTSHMMLHVWDKGAEVGDASEFHFDLYSCSDFNPEEVVNKLNEEFTIIQGAGTVIDRQKGTMQGFRLKLKDGKIIL